MYITYMKDKESNMTIETAKCKLCGKIFEQKVFWQRFCCPEHRERYWKEIQHGKHDLNKRLEEVEKKLGINK